jgi:uncharacterized membrane protein YkvA (DUF1232 family)
VKISFELSNKDLQYFRKALREVRSGDHAEDEGVVIGGAQNLVAEALEQEVPDFVRERIVQLEQLTGMLTDEDWRLEGKDRTRVLNALVYFVDPDDLIPDRVPGIGYLDDAIMVELVVRELKHELQAYADFCEFRKTNPGGVRERLEARRRALQMRMRRRRRRRSASGSGTRRAPSTLRLW